MFHLKITHPPPPLTTFSKLADMSTIPNERNESVVRGQVSTNEKRAARKHRGSFMAVMDPWNPPMRIKTPETWSQGWCWFGFFLKWWYQTTMGFPTTKIDNVGVFWRYHYFWNHPFGETKTKTVWLWQLKDFLFHPENWGRWTHVARVDDNIISKGFVQPPTRKPNQKWVQSFWWCRKWKKWHFELSQNWFKSKSMIFGGSEG